MRIYLYIPFGSYLYLLNLLEMHTAYKQAVCVSVLQCAANSEISNDKQTHTQLPPTLLKGSVFTCKYQMYYLKNHK